MSLVRKQNLSHLIQQDDNGKFKCGHCADKVPKCCKCWQLIDSGMTVVAFGKNWHKQCLPCVYTFLVFTIKEMTDSNSTEVSKSYDSFGECKICHQLVKTEGMNTPGFGYIHMACFKCLSCGRKFDLNETPGNLICQECHAIKREAMADLCFQCGKPILDAPKLALKHKYHASCVSCFKCKRDLLWEPKNLGGTDFFFSTLSTSRHHNPTN
eukprot:TRINITY_DN2887_c0_g1_i10.p1 TRINITY_DN2887_c0_g1~~TRINITY_DN2887_c0_g1_i10.p1  ORF type:complete len:211 (+),score=15.69 TRINITY_DN2887_c0_g1_i10:261-893(+)